jgi:uncharacterized protein YcnI
MNPRLRSTLRAVCAAAAATGVCCVGSLAGAAPASAHVHVDAESPVQGDTTIVSFRVPNESETGSATTALTITLPAVDAARSDVMAGWTSALQRDPATGAVQSVTWTATPEAGIFADQFEIFQMQVTLPAAETVLFPAVQTYADGTEVRWDQPTDPGAAEPNHPAPTLTLTPAERTEDSPAQLAPAQGELGPDNVARALAGSALLLAAIGVGIAFVRRGA